MNHAIYANTDWFATSGYCLEHRNYHCSDCYEEAIEEEKESAHTALVLPVVEAVSSTSVSVYDPKVQNSMDVFAKQLAFIKRVKKWNDAKLKKIKVTEINTLLEQCQKECTVGDLEEFIEDQKSNTGFWAVITGKK